MEHKFSPDYDESALPVADKGSFVIPIPKGDMDIFEGPAVTVKIWSQPRGFGPAVSQSAGEWREGVIKPPPPPRVLSEGSPEEETVRVLLETVGTDGQPDAEVVEEESKMDTVEKPAKTKCPPLLPAERRNHDRRRKRGAGNYTKLYLLCWMAVIRVPVSEGFPGFPGPGAERRVSKEAASHSFQPLKAAPDANQNLTCLNCTDNHRCQKLLNIYDRYDDTHLYQRDLSETLPGCHDISPPGPKRCAVCLDQFHILIYCPEDLGRRINVENSDGDRLNITSLCTCRLKGVGKQIPGHSHVGLVISLAFFFIVVAALVIRICCQKKSIGSGQQ